MSKKLIGLIVAIATICSMVAAQEPKGRVLAEWLKGQRQKIALIVPKKAGPRNALDTATRETKDNASARLYWKGKKDDEPVTEEELSEHKKGIDLAEKGDTTGAVKELDLFMKQYPDSALIPDAKKTLDLVKAGSR